VLIIFIFYLGAADWARKTLKDHSKDKREHLYTREVRPAMIKKFYICPGFQIRITLMQIRIHPLLKCEIGSGSDFSLYPDPDPPLLQKDANLRPSRAPF
jgi:hypothetical protein